MIKEKMVSFRALTDAGSPVFDIGNTGANAASIMIPFKFVVDKILVYSTTAVANSFTVSCDSLIGATQGAEDVGKVIVPDSTSAFAALYDVAGRGVVLNAGNRVLVQVDEAGDSGEKGMVILVGEYFPEYESNQTAITQTA